MIYRENQSWWAVRRQYVDEAGNPRPDAPGIIVSGIMAKFRYYSDALKYKPVDGCGQVWTLEEIPAE